MNYSDIQGFQFQMPVQAIKKPWGTGAQVGDQTAYAIKMENDNTNVFIFHANTDISIQTSGISPEPFSIVAELDLPLLVPSTQSVICIIKNWNLRIELFIKGTRTFGIKTDECRAVYTGLDSGENGTSQITEHTVGSPTRVVIGGYKTKMDINESGTVTKKDVYELGAYAYGDFLGFKGWFLICGLGWIPDYYGVTPSLEKPEVRYNQTSYGGGSRGSNDNNTQGVPELPNFSYASHGKRTYLLNQSKSQEFHAFLWSTDFVDSLIKVYAQPMQTIESMFVNDCGATSQLTGNIQLGNVNSEISADLTNSFVEIDCGTVYYNEEYGSYIDYEPFVQCQLYLPRIGVVPISANDVVNNALHVLYQIDLVTGFGTCYVIVTHTRDNYSEVLMQISAQMLSPVPYSGLDSSARVNAAAQCVTNLIGGNLLGAATNALSTNFAPCNVQKSPISSSLLLSQKKPALMISRNDAVLPETYGEDVGFMCMVSDKLSGKTGFFKIRDAHTPMINNDSWISSEIDRLLEQGVYIK